MLAAGPADSTGASWLGAVAVALAAVNVFGGFLVTQRMLEMFKKKEPKAAARERRGTRDDAMSANQVTLLYLVAVGLLHPGAKGLSHPHTARRGNLLRHGRHGDRRAHHAGADLLDDATNVGMILARHRRRRRDRRHRRAGACR